MDASPLVIRAALQQIVLPIPHNANNYVSVSSRPRARSGALVLEWLVAAIIVSRGLLEYA